MPNLNTATIGGLPTYEPPNNISGINRFVMRTGASRYGKGAFAMLRKDYDSLVTQTSKTGGMTKLVMKGDPGPGLTMTVILAAAEPLTTQVTTDASYDLMKVVVYDNRCRGMTPFKKFYNVVMDGYPLDGSNNPICFSSTLKATTPPAPPGFVPFDWGTIVTALAAADNLPSSIPDWTPYNLIWDSVPLVRALDDVASQLFYVVGFDHQNDSLSEALSLFPPYLSARGTEDEDQGFDANFALLDQTKQKNCLIGGAVPGTSHATERNNSRLPGQIAVVFPAVGSSDPYSSQRTYSNTQSTGFGKNDYTITLNVGNRFAVWNGSAWLNQSDLDTVAQDLASRAAIFISQAFGQAEFAGIWPFRPDGRFRQVEWVSYPKGHPQEGARTIVSTDNARDWLPWDSIEDPINLPSNQEIIGLGSSAFSISVTGAKYSLGSVGDQVLEISANGTRPGAYSANPFVANSASFTSTGSSPITASDLGAARSSTVLFINLSELNKDPSDPSQHDLTTGDLVIARYWTMDGSTPPVPTYIGRTFDAGDCSG